MLVRALGKVKAILRYPVKSMAGEALNSVPLGWGGLEGDRRLAFRRENDSSGFPWLTAGKLPALVLYRPLTLAHATASTLPTHVATPGGETLELHGEALRQELSARHGSEVRLMYLRQGVYDEAPISLISTTTIAAIEAAAGHSLGIRRFRPNLVIETADDVPFPEDAWIGKTLRIGTDTPATIAVTLPDVRCGMLNLDPETAVADPMVLKTLVRLHGNCAGVYGTTFRQGVVSVGDLVYGEEA